MTIIKLFLKKKTTQNILAAEWAKTLVVFANLKRCIWSMEEKKLLWSITIVIIYGLSFATICNLLFFNH